MKQISKFIFNIILFFIIFCILVFLRDTYIPTVKHLKISIPGLEKNSKIVFISDLQIGNLLTNRRLIAKIVNEQHPDIIVLGGDMIDDVNDVNYIEDYIKSFRADHKFYVFGNHEEPLTDTQDLELHAIMEKHNYIFIDNKAVSFKGFNLIGLGDAVSQFCEPEKAFNNKLINFNKYNVVVTHSNDANLLLDTKRYKTDVLLSGHSHGGQIDIPFVKSNRANSILWKEHNLYKGTYYFQGENVRILNHTSNGLGGSDIPYRFLAPQEIFVLNLRAAN